MEGTLVTAEGDDPRGLTTETDVEHECVRLFKETQGLALIAYSSQNIDRLVTLYRATLQADRDFVMDLYAAAVAVATGHPTIPRPGWNRVRVFVPHRQRVQVKESGEFSRVDSIKPARIFHEELTTTPERFVLTFRASMARDLERAKCLEGARLVWSLWQGEKGLIEDGAQEGRGRRRSGLRGRAARGGKERRTGMRSADLAVALLSLQPSSPTT